MNRRADIIIYAVSLLLLIGAATLWWQGVFASSNNELTLLPSESAGHAKDAGESRTPTTAGDSNVPDAELPDQDVRPDILVHVTGAVKTPGVYRLKEGQRVYEALELAEPLDSADTEYLNLAGLLYDQDKIYVPEKGEFTDAAGSGSAGAGSNHGAAGTPGTPGANSDSNLPRFPININSATAKELEALPGIGPSKAGAIIEFRQQRGPFSVKEDIKKVSGIGDVTYSKIEHLITVR